MSEDPEAVSRDELVDQVARRPRNEPDRRGGAPRPGEQAQSPPGGVAVLVGAFAIDKDNRAAVAGVADFLEDGVGDGGLQRRVVEPSAVTADQPADRPIA